MAPRGKQSLPLRLAFALLWIVVALRSHALSILPRRRGSARLGLCIPHNVVYCSQVDFHCADEGQIDLSIACQN